MSNRGELKKTMEEHSELRKIQKQQETARIKQLKEKGLTTKQIALRVGVSQVTVRRRLKENEEQ